MRAQKNRVHLSQIRRSVDSQLDDARRLPMGVNHEAVVRSCLDCLVARHLETALDHYADDATLTLTYFSAFEPSPRGAARSLV
jgi:hypothetical protein